jgi:hypothetical protein
MSWIRASSTPRGVIRLDEEVWRIFHPELTPGWLCALVPNQLPPVVNIISTTKPVYAREDSHATLVYLGAMEESACKSSGRPFQHVHLIDCSANILLQARHRALAVCWLLRVGGMFG